MAVEAFAERTLAEWRQALEGFSGQWAVVQDTLEATADPQAVANGYVQNYESAAGEPFTLVSPPVQFGGRPAAPRRAPDFNEHGDEILQRILELDYDQIIELKIQNVIPLPQAALQDREGSMDQAKMADIIEIEHLLARYAVGMTKDNIDVVVKVFTPDGWYSAFGDRYTLADFPRLASAAPKGLYLVGPSEIELNGDEATGTQPLCFVEQTNHNMRIGYYDDTYRRTEQGWRLATRSMTFLLNDPLGKEILTATDDPGMAYGIAKAGVIQLVKRTAVAWGPRGARCVSISPGCYRDAHGNRRDGIGFRGQRAHGDGAVRPPRTPRGDRRGDRLSVLSCGLVHHRCRHPGRRRSDRRSQLRMKFS